MNLPKTTIVYGIILIMLGMIGYFVTSQTSVTALIPAFFGMVIVIAGALAQKEPRRKHAMHAAAALALLGFFGTFRGIGSLVTLIGGGEVARPAAAISQSIMAVLSLGFVLLCIKSFKDARRNKAA